MSKCVCQGLQKTVHICDVEEKAQVMIGSSSKWVDLWHKTSENECYSNHDLGFSLLPYSSLQIGECVRGQWLDRQPPIFLFFNSKKVLHYHTDKCDLCSYFDTCIDAKEKYRFLTMNKKLVYRINQLCEGNKGESNLLLQPQISTIYCFADFNDHLSQFIYRNQPSNFQCLG